MIRGLRFDFVTLCEVDKYAGDSDFHRSCIRKSITEQRVFNGDRQAINSGEERRRHYG
jgi:hypothetical protein